MNITRIVRDRIKENICIDADTICDVVDEALEDMDLESIIREALSEAIKGIIEDEVEDAIGEAVADSVTE